MLEDKIEVAHVPEQVDNVTVSVKPRARIVAREVEVSREVEVRSTEEVEVEVATKGPLVERPTIVSVVLHVASTFERARSVPSDGTNHVANVHTAVNAVSPDWTDMHLHLSKTIGYGVEEIATTIRHGPAGS